MNARPALPAPSDVAVGGADVFEVSVIDHGVRYHPGSVSKAFNSRAARNSALGNKSTERVRGEEKKEKKITVAYMAYACSGINLGLFVGQVNELEVGVDVRVGAQRWWRRKRRGGICVEL